MSDDALERLKRRQRPEVPTRDTTLNPRSIDTSISRNLESLEQNAPALKKRSDELKTKQSTLRIEAQVSDRIQQVCRTHGLSREVLIEALFLHYESDPQAWQSIIAEAKKRADYRQQVANLRRAQSMIQRFGEQP